MTSREVGRGRDGLREQHAANRLEAVGEFLDLVWAPLHDDDLQTRFFAEVRVCARPDRAKERMLAVQDAVGDHSDVVSIEERDRPDRASTRLYLPTSEGRPDQVSQGLRTAPIPSVSHESVERFQEWTFERDADSGNRHGRYPSGKRPRPQE